MIKKNKTFLFVVFLLIAFLSMIPLPPAHAATLHSNWLNSAETPPIIDGVISAGEWTKAAPNSFTLYQFEDSSYKKSATLWALNDANFLYLRIEWADPTKARYEAPKVYDDYIIVHFDENNDDNWATPDGTQNAAKVRFYESSSVLTTSYLDGYGKAIIYGSIGTTSDTQHGSGMGSWSSSKYNVEMKLPLSSTDTKDLQPGAGASMRIFILVYDSEKPGTNPYYEYPVEGYSLAFDYYNRPNTVTFQLADQPPDKPSNPSPANGATNVALNATLRVLVSDPSGDSMTIRFYNASDNRLIGTKTGVASGKTANITWLNLPANTTQQWYATASDHSSTTKSNTWSFTTGTGSEIPGFNLVLCAFCLIPLLALIMVEKRLRKHRY